ncbi:hypothetical protein IKN40_02870 [bacterium]|jgi:hypothetical protein|nr:hypothetical protein [bacterium]
MIVIKSGCLLTICHKRDISFTPFAKCIFASLTIWSTGNHFSSQRANGTIQYAQNWLHQLDIGIYAVLLWLFILEFIPSGIIVEYSFVNSLSYDTSYHNLLSINGKNQVSSIRKNNSILGHF